MSVTWATWASRPWIPFLHAMIRPAYSAGWFLDVDRLTQTWRTPGSDGVWTAVVLGDDESLDDTVELLEGERRGCNGGAVRAVRYVAWQVREELGGDRPIELLDLPATLPNAGP